jgi:hypothetical protein
MVCSESLFIFAVINSSFTAQLVATFRCHSSKFTGFSGEQVVGGVHCECIAKIPTYIFQHGGSKIVFALLG